MKGRNEDKIVTVIFRACIAGIVAIIAGFILLVPVFFGEPAEAQHPSFTPGYHVTYALDTSGDVAIKASAGVLHSVTVSNIPSTAGSFALENSVAGAGADIICDVYVDDATTWIPFTLILDCEFDTGLYLDFDGTLAGSAVTITYW